MASPFFSWQHTIIRSQLEPTTRLVCLTIGTHMAADGSGCFPSYATIAEETGLSRSTVILHVQKAADAGYLTITSRDRGNGSHTSNLYQPTMPVGGPVNGPGVVREPDQGSPVAGLGVVRQPDPRNSPAKQTTEPSPKAPKGPCAWEEDSGFVSVVDAMKAVRPDRVDLQKAWEVWQTESLQDRAEAIVSAIQRLSRQEQWKKEGGRFVPRLSRFLRERSWAVVSKDMVPPTEIAAFRQRTTDAINAHAAAERIRRFGR